MAAPRLILFLTVLFFLCPCVGSRLAHAAENEGSAKKSGAARALPLEQDSAVFTDGVPPPASDARPRGLSDALSMHVGIDLPALDPTTVRALRMQSGPDWLGPHRTLPRGEVQSLSQAEAAAAELPGTWSFTLDNEPIWRLTIRSAEAAAIAIRFEAFDIHGEVWVYTHDGEAYAGPYSGRGPRGNGAFWSAPLSSDAVTVEYVPRRRGIGETKPPFRIPRISHHVRPERRKSVASPLTPRRTAIPGPGERSNLFPFKDATCSVEWLRRGADNEVDLRDSAASLLIQTQEGSRNCSGVLLARLSDAGTELPPYYAAVLTNGHCVENHREAIGTTLYWRYRTDTCDGPRPSRGSLAFTAGARLWDRELDWSWSDDRGQDYALLLVLKDALPSGLTFAGWTTRDVTPGQDVFTLGHPKTEPLRLAVGEVLPPPENTEFSSSASFRARPKYGFQFKGSSGSGAFSGLPAIYRVVGVHYGGQRFTAGTALQGDGYIHKFSDIHDDFRHLRHVEPETQRVSYGVRGETHWSTFFQIPAGDPDEGSWVLDNKTFIWSGDSFRRAGKEFQVVLQDDLWEVVPTDDYGDTQAEAASISLGSSIEGVIGNDDPWDVDWFRFETNEPMTVEVYTTGAAETVGILNDTEYDDGGDGNNFLIVASIPAGVHYVQVTGPPPFSTRGGAETYTLHVRSATDPSGGRTGADDHGNTQDAATEVALGSGPAWDERWVQGERAEIDRRLSQLRRVIALDDATASAADRKFVNDQRQRLLTEIRNELAVIFSGVDPGGLTRASWALGRTDAWTAHLDYPTDTAGVARDAVVIAEVQDVIAALGAADAFAAAFDSGGIFADFPSGLGIRSGRIDPSGDEDWFRFTTTEPATVEVYTTGETDTFGQLNDSASDDDSGEGLNFRIEASVSAGTHFVNVSGFAGYATGAYTLHVRVVESAGTSVPPLDDFRCETCGLVPGFDVTAFRGGDFSELAGPVIDPACDCPFPNNVIPQSRLLPHGAWPEDVYKRNEREGTFGLPGGRVARLVAQGWTPLHEAAGNGSRYHPRGRLNPAELDRVLADWPQALEAGLRNSGSRSGWTPLHLAANRGDLGVVERLLAGGAAVDPRALDGATPLLRAGSPEVFAALRGAGAGLHASTDSGWTALHRAAWVTDAATVRALLAAGLDPNAATTNGWTPLHYARTREVFAALRAAGADVHASTDSGWTALHRAAWATDAATVRALVAAGLDPNAARTSGTTPLHSARTREVFEALLELGADRAVIDAVFDVDAYFAVVNGEEGAFSRTQVNRSVQQVGRLGDAAWFERLREINPDFYAVGDRPGSATLAFPLHYAAQYNEDPAVLAALTGDASATLGWEVTVAGAGEWHWFDPLERAASDNPNPAVVAALLAAGADPNAGDALYYAARRRAPRAAEIVELLLAAGADVDGSEYGGEPVYAAAMARNLEALDALIAAGADVNVTGSRYLSLLADVLSRGRFDCGYGPVADRLSEARALALQYGANWDWSAEFTPGPPVAVCAAFQPQEVLVDLGENGGTVTLLTTADGGFTLGGEAFAGGADSPVEGEGGRRYVLTLGEDGMTWTALHMPRTQTVALGTSGESVELMTTEAGGFTLGGDDFSGGSVTASNGNEYRLALGEDGTWTATFVAPDSGGCPDWNDRSVQDVRAEMVRIRDRVAALVDLYNADGIDRETFETQIGRQWDAADAELETLFGGDRSLERTSSPGRVVDAFDRVVAALSSAEAFAAATLAGGPDRLQGFAAGGCTTPAVGATWTNALGMEFVEVPAGSFVMGSPEVPHWPGQFLSDAFRQHEVRISQGFWMGKYEVTQGEWEAVMGKNPSYDEACGPRCPVESVSWDDAQAFIRRLNEREAGSEYAYRLPTEAEWEYAARAGTTGAFYGEPDEIAWHEGNSSPWYEENSGGRPPVGAKRANAWGLHDMLGNVWEWTADWYGEYPSGAVTDPPGPSAGSDRVIRGGGWQHDGPVSSAGRRSLSPGTRLDNIGFRLVRASFVPSQGSGGFGDCAEPLVRDVRDGMVRIRDRVAALVDLYNADGIDRETFETQIGRQWDAADAELETLFGGDRSLERTSSPGRVVDAFDRVVAALSSAEAFAAATLAGGPDRLQGFAAGGCTTPAVGATWTNALGMEFVEVPAGSFVMGSPEDEDGRFDDDEGPQREVTLSRGFWMGKYEVTQGEWEAVMGSNPSWFSDCGPRCPVEYVSWEDVQVFVGRLNERAAAAGSAARYRLPTEAEWEYAARAGTTGARHGELDDIAWWSGNSGGNPQPVGGKRANAWGLHDMLGNVWEWTADWFDRYPSGAVTDPTGPSTGSIRVVRGGGWDSFRARSVRSAYRNSIWPGGRHHYVGFRLVRTN